MGKEHRAYLTSQRNCFKKIPPSRPDLKREDFNYVAEILKSRQVAGGPFVERLEEAFCSRLGIRHALAVSSGTAALHLALLALNIGHGDEVIVPSYGCAALLHSVFYTGAAPVLADINPDTLNITEQEIRPLISRRTKAIIITHTFGFPADMEAILRFNVPVIEDCAQSLGARYQGCEAGTFGLISVFSFYATKVICAGEGGMVCTAHRRIASMLRDLNTPDKRANYKVRYNYKMSDLSAGLAFRQFSRLDKMIERRKRIAACYIRAFKACRDVKFQASLPGTEPIYYRFVIGTRHAKTLMEKAASQGIMCGRPVFRPLHQYLGLSAAQFPHTVSAWKTHISVPLYPSLTEKEVRRVTAVVRETLK